MMNYTIPAHQFKDIYLGNIVYIGMGISCGGLGMLACTDCTLLDSIPFGQEMGSVLPFST
jgi:hypothetical protein